MMMSFCSIFAAASIAGCGDHVVVGGDLVFRDGGSGGTPTMGMGGTAGEGGSGGASGASGASGAGGASGASGASGAGGGAGQTDAGLCPAACGTPGGTVQVFTSPADVYAALVGTWHACSGLEKVFGAAPADAIGIEYGAPGEKGGNAYYLVAGASGPERGAGFAYQLTYEVAQSGSSPQLYMHPTPNSGFSPSARFSPCPNEWEMRAMYATDTVVLVPFD
jgi:hypothetical protein